MRLRTKLQEFENLSLGPGSYNHTKVISGKKPPSYSMGLKNWKKKFENTPGPGTYQTDRSTVSNVPSSRFKLFNSELAILRESTFPRQWTHLVWGITI